MENGSDHLYLFVDASYREDGSGGGWFATDMRTMALGSFRLPTGLANSETAEGFALGTAFGLALGRFPQIRSLTLLMDNLAVIDRLTGCIPPDPRYNAELDKVIALSNARGVRCEVAHVKAHQSRRDMQFICNAVVDRLANFGRLGHLLDHAEPFRHETWASRLKRIDPELTVLRKSIPYWKAAELLRCDFDDVLAMVRRRKLVVSDRPEEVYTHSVLRIANQMRACGRWGQDFERHRQAQADAPPTSRYAERPGRGAVGMRTFVHSARVATPAP